MLLRIAAVIFALVPLCGATQRLDVELRLMAGEQPLAFDTLAVENGAQTLSVTRCDLLLSGAALMREDGTWIGAESWAAFINGRDGRTRFNLSAIPEGRYAKLRFNIGLAPALNHSDPAKYPAGHPLNPTLNGLHWGWQGGYIFAALEGFWKSPGSAMSGYSFHLANDENLTSVELPVDLDLSRGQTLRLAMDFQTVLHGIAITTENPATHSREGDPIAARLRENFRNAFRIESLSLTPSREEAAQQKKALISPGAHPYRLTFSASFPRPSLPTDNPLTAEGVALGEQLFRDPRLSGNGRQSCHRPAEGFSDRRRVSIGAFGDEGSRQSMPLFNLAWKSSYFWDGRAPNLREQVLVPIQDRKEMHASLDQVVGKIADDPAYILDFDEAFGAKEIDADQIARALEQYLLTVVSDDSKFDRAMRGTEKLSDREQLGLRIFNTEFDPKRGLRGGDCFHCHGGPLFQSVSFANNGLDGSPPDLGLGKTTGREGDAGKFSVPSLRNIALTAPYMHDGRFKTLEEVIDHYDHGVQRNPTLDPNLAKHPAEGLQLSADEKSALVAFLKTLTGEEAGRLPPSLPPPFPKS